ncbi:UdgX family uracil-DNA binding protein [Jannaschia rubra]|uniref:UdgX family uracil-DNA binding protein n=1 Tax=Jannaschia rubra TaxID=282197 RepID=UPI002492C42E|nr:UdgX family uracil-DNA binding protein [Jannaschia rubra]
MFAPRLPRIGTYAAWRDAARGLALAGVAPSAVDWGLTGETRSMFDAPLPAGEGQLLVPKAFLDLTRSLIPERSGRGMALAYALLHRLQGDPSLLGNRADADVARAHEIAKSIRRDIHKMHAFVRFREIAVEGDRRAFSAWFEPDHRIEEETAGFFADRFGDMDWQIVTPEVVIAHVAGQLSLEAVPSVRPDGDDALEELWTTYYSNIFNPARLKPAAMRAEMPRKYWRNLPETRAIPSLIAGARGRVSAMQAAGPSLPAPQSLRRKVPTMPEHPLPDAAPPGDLATLRHLASDCTRCPLYGPATQVVFGEGPADARLVIVGEQPGDREDIEGRPFVGPAGQLFDRIAAEAGLDRSTAYVTNAVKHFKFVQRGKRRIHQRPNTSEVSACRWWLDREVTTVDPDLVVAMGATAMGALTGKATGLLKRRGGIETTADGRPVLITVHPSYLLRLPDPQLRERETELFRDDLVRVRSFLEDPASLRP